ncbi:hypothetical protein BDZ94DRAFT_892612 [Collybia nuda]|uniref:Uncharacterized protein n=1 Tax=Collybia nuda TaxID=64659 RepID=A0A9P5Y3P4_9AGAR|nr:hypothetical protein BDZ94DRAFT_892612 [Collybia nuda]
MPCPYLALLRAGKAPRGVHSFTLSQLIAIHSTASFSTHEPLPPCHNLPVEVEDCVTTKPDLSTPQKPCPPEPLPPPIMFEGPSRPRNPTLCPRLQHPRQRQTYQQPINYTPEPLVELFDGPSRFGRRYTKRKRNSRRFIFFVITASGVIIGTSQLT